MPVLELCVGGIFRASRSGARDEASGTGCQGQGRCQVDAILRIDSGLLGGLWALRLHGRHTCRLFFTGALPGVRAVKDPGTGGHIAASL